MSDEVIPDLTLLSGLAQETAREVRLQLDNLVARAAGTDQRIAVLEQSFHELVGEMARGFALQQQQLTRLEKRFDQVDAGLTELREGAAEGRRQMKELLALLRR